MRGSSSKPDILDYHWYKRHTGGSCGNGRIRYFESITISFSAFHPTLCPLLFLFSIRLSFRSIFLFFFTYFPIPPMPFAVGRVVLRQLSSIVSPTDWHICCSKLHCSLCTPNCRTFCLLPSVAFTSDGSNTTPPASVSTSLLIPQSLLFFCLFRFTLILSVLVACIFRILMYPARQSYSRSSFISQPVQHPFSPFP